MIMLGCFSAGAAIAWIPSALAQVYDSAGDFYCYAPVVVRDGGSVHYWFCRNAEAGVIRDHIFHFQQSKSSVKPGPLSKVFSPAPGNGWDSFHVCDPSVVKGRFGFDERRYSYAMFYLGNNVDASADNQVGVAFANSPGQEWLRHPEPLVSYPPRGHWGAGQPSAVNLDGKGRIALFYTKADPRTAAYVRTIIFSRDGKISVGEETRLPTAGLIGTEGRPDHLNNFDVALDTARKRYFAVREVHPYPRTNPNFISTTVEVVSIPVDEIQSPNARWTSEGIIGPELTGHARNHNAAIEKTWFGALPDRDRIRVVFTVSCAEPDCAGRTPLWTYHLWQISGTITK
jgi:hypothetical protein